MGATLTIPHNIMEITLSTSHALTVLITPNLRFCGQRHSDRRTGASVWETWFEQFGEWRVHNNPFDRKDFTIVEKWAKIKGNTYKGVRLAKTWSYKKDILNALNQIV